MLPIVAHLCVPWLVPQLGGMQHVVDFFLFFNGKHPLLHFLQQAIDVDRGICPELAALAVLVNKLFYTLETCRQWYGASGNIHSFLHARDEQPLNRCCLRSKANLACVIQLTIDAFLCLSRILMVADVLLR